MICLTFPFFPAYLSGPCFKQPLQLQNIYCKKTVVNLNFTAGYWVLMRGHGIGENSRVQAVPQEENAALFR